MNDSHVLSSTHTYTLLVSDKCFLAGFFTGNCSKVRTMGYALKCCCLESEVMPVADLGNLRDCSVREVGLAASEMTEQGSGGMAEQTQRHCLPLTLQPQRKGENPSLKWKAELKCNL